MASVAPGYHDQIKVGQRQNFAVKKSITLTVQIIQGEAVGLSLD